MVVAILTKHDLHSFSYSNHVTLLFAHLKSEAAIHESISLAGSAIRPPFLRNSFILVAYFAAAEWALLLRIIGQECDGNEGKRLWAVVRPFLAVMNSK